MTGGKTSSSSVAIIVRTKDRPDLLHRALRDIAQQSFDDWECVVVNDGGDAGEVDGVIANTVSDRGGRVRAVHHADARGRWISANAGILATTAPLIVLHDDDDSWHPDFLQHATAYLNHEPARVGVVSRIEILWERRTESGFEVTGREVFQPSLTTPTLADALLFNRFVPIAFLYRRDLHAEFGLYDERLPVMGDWAFNLKVLAKHPLEFLGDVPYAYWHQRVDSAGAEGNSVIDARSDHARVDGMLRDEALREYVAEHGLGLPLYLTRFIDQRFVDVENGIREEIRRATSMGRVKDAVARRLRRRTSEPPQA